MPTDSRMKPSVMPSLARFSGGTDAWVMIAGCSINDSTPPSDSARVTTLQSATAERGLVAFTALPVLLAKATLDRVEEVGPGAKLTRPEVAAIVSEMNQALDESRPAVPL